MNEKIERKDLIDIQQEISDAYYERALNINKKHSINEGLKHSVKITGLMAILSVLAMMLPVNAVSICFWIATAIAAGTFAGFGIAKYNNFATSNELTEKIEDLEQLQKDMAIDYNIKAIDKVDVTILNETSLKNRERKQKLENITIKTDEKEL